MDSIVSYSILHIQQKVNIYIKYILNNDKNNAKNNAKNPIFFYKRSGFLIRKYEYSLLCKCAPRFGKDDARCRDRDCRHPCLSAKETS